MYVTAQTLRQGAPMILPRVRSLRIALCEGNAMNIDDYVRTAATAAILTPCLALGACSERTNREDFASLIKGKTEQEVRKNAGKPDSVDETKKDRHVWTYNSRTFDVQQQNKFDARTVVVFTRSPEGKMVVAEVKFE